MVSSHFVLLSPRYIIHPLTKMYTEQPSSLNLPENNSPYIYITNVKIFCTLYRMIFYRYIKKCLLCGLSLQNNQSLFSQKIKLSHLYYYSVYTK